MSLLTQCTGFLAVVKYQSIRSASLYTHISAMGLSKQIKQLESYLGENLFERTGRELKLTDFGQAFIPQAKKLIACEKSIQDWADDNKTKVQGKLKVIVKPEILAQGFVPYIAEFCRLYPEVEVELEVSHQPIIPASTEFDLILGFPEYIGRVQQGLVRKKIFSSDVAIVASPKYLAEYGTPADPGELKFHRLIGDRIMQPHYKLFVKEGDEYTREQEANLQGLPVAIKTNDMAIAAELAVNHMGIAQAPLALSSVMEKVEQGLLIPILTKYTYKDWPLFCYYHPLSYPLKKLQVFMAFFDPVFKILMEKRCQKALKILNR